VAEEQSVAIGAQAKDVNRVVCSHSMDAAQRQGKQVRHARMKRRHLVEKLACTF
jgi:hypothetical protein